MEEFRPCPICGNDNDYLRFVELCARKANEIWYENEIQTMVDICKSLNFAPVVRCSDCIRYLLDDYGNTWCAYVASAVQPYDFCAWGERK